MSDILFVVGTILAVLSIVTVLTAWIENRRPRVASIVVVIAGGMLLFAASTTDDGFHLTDIQDAFINVVAMVLN